MLQKSHVSHWAIVKSDKIRNTEAKINRQGKVIIFKSKVFSIYTTEFAYVNIFPKKIVQIFSFWAGQSLRLSRNTCFLGFKSSFAENSHGAKPERLDLSKM